MDKAAVVRRYLNRKIHMALALLDVGPGDTHCQARDQGGSHLDRGSNMVLHLAKVNNGTFPPTQTVDFIANTSHQDYAMLSTNTSLHWLFINDYNVRNPDIVAFNPSEAHKNKTKLPKQPKKFATHGNILLASSLLGGSLLFVLTFFIILPFVFTPNWVEEDLQALQYEKALPLLSRTWAIDKHGSLSSQPSQLSPLTPTPRSPFGKIQSTARV
jgi:hypothetical protein